MTNVLALVTRFYGGIKLGVPGLIDAYGGTVEKTLELAEKASATDFAGFVVKAEYAVVDQLTGLLRTLGGKVASENWTDRAELAIRVPAQNADALREFLAGQAAQSRLEYFEENDHA